MRAMELASGAFPQRRAFVPKKKIAAPCSSDPPDARTMELVPPESGHRHGRVREEGEGVEGWPPQPADPRTEPRGAGMEGRKGKEEGEERRGREDPAAAMARSLARPDPAAAGARHLDSRLAGRACSPVRAGRASRVGEEAAEGPNPAGGGGPESDRHWSSPPRFESRRLCLLAGTRGAGKPGRGGGGGGPESGRRRSSPPRSAPRRPRLLDGARGAGEPAGEVRRRRRKRGAPAGEVSRRRRK